MKDIPEITALELKSIPVPDSKVQAIDENTANSLLNDEELDLLLEQGIYSTEKSSEDPIAKEIEAKRTELCKKLDAIQEDKEKQRQDE